MRRPIKSEPGYEVTVEYCGHPKPRHVLRFCGEFVGSFTSYPAAALRAVGHNNIRKGQQPVTEKTSSN